MSSSIELFIMLLLTGLLLIGAEVYIPGGVVGAIGAMALLGAMATGFSAFGLQAGFIAAVMIVVLCGVFMVLWVRFFPRTSMGRKMMLGKDEKTFKSAPDLKALLGHEGVALSDLRPSGIAQIEDRRVDVVTDGVFIPAQTRVCVVAVEGARILVREQTPATESA